MSTARLIPETWELGGDDAWRTLRRTGRRRLLRDAGARLRWADGFSHSRSLAFVVALAAIQGIVAVVGLASAFGGSALGEAVVDTINGAAPGPVAGLLTGAVTQAEGTGHAHNYLPLLFGTLGWLVTATTAMGQLERGLNRLYGIEQDRRSTAKYARALLLAASSGVLLALAFGLLAFGRAAAAASGGGGTARLFDVASWPAALAVLGVCIGWLFRWCPRRHQPAWSWLAFGAGVSLVLWAVITAGLGTFFRHSAHFGETYGPLAGVVALLVWAVLSSMALFYGAAVAAQLEAVRAAAAPPHDDGKAAASEPGAVDLRDGAVPSLPERR